MPPKAATIDSSIINSLIEIERSGQPGFLSQVLNLFIESTPEHIRKIGKAIEASDADAVKAYSHSLKSSSAGVGANHLSDLCKELENLAHAGAMEPVHLKGLQKQLQIEFENVCRELKKYQTVQD